jgi:ketosteroid isomerase-like protein
MRKDLNYISLSISIILLTVRLSFGNQSNESEKVSRNDSALIFKLVNNFTDAVVKRDEAAINELISDDFIYTENEKMYSRSEVIQSFLSPTDIIESAYNEDLQVRIYDKTAIVTGWLYINGKSSGTDLKKKYRFTDIWYFKDRRWQIIAALDYLLS